MKHLQLLLQINPSEHWCAPQATALPPTLTGVLYLILGRKTTCKYDVQFRKSQKGRLSSGASQPPPKRALLTSQVCPNIALHLKCWWPIKYKPITTKEEGRIQGRVRLRHPAYLITFSPRFKNYTAMQVIKTEGSKTSWPQALTFTNKHTFTI